MNSEKKVLKFPNGFFWGSATSSYQVEGGCDNDWTAWEKKKAAEQAARGGSTYHKPEDPELLAEAGKPENYVCGRACDHYHRYEEDFDIAKSLNQNAHRFSIEWSRIEPEEGKFDEKEIEHYRRVVRALKARGIEPFITLWHYTHPRWFLERGGWTDSGAKDRFLRYAARVVDALQDEVKYWITYNEPETVARDGYLLGTRPPFKKNPFLASKALDTLVDIHNAAYGLIHQIDRDAKVGCAESLVFFESFDRWPHNLLAKRLLEWWRNGRFVPRIVGASDFIGLQYYFHSRIRLHPWKSWKGFQSNENKRVTDMGWEIYPEGIYHVLKDLKKYGLPVYITENGLADHKDRYRADFIREHLVWVHRAIEDGVDVCGYFYWTMLDNFEWESGFWPRFGLVEVDRQTLERRIRPSALAYAEICRKNELKID